MKPQKNHFCKFPTLIRELLHRQTFRDGLSLFIKLFISLEVKVSFRKVFIWFFTKKITGRKRPALVDPSHKVRQGGKGSVWDGQTDRWTLPVHFQSTSGSLPVHLGTRGGHMRHHSYSLPKNEILQNLRTDGQTDIRTYIQKKMTPKDPLRINAQDLKIKLFQLLLYLGEIKKPVSSQQISFQ